MVVMIEDTFEKSITLYISMVVRKR